MSVVKRMSSNNKPIEVFKSVDQFKECCEYWQHTLFLDSWFIRFALTTDEIKDDEGNFLWGVCEHHTEGSAASITIYNKRDFESEETDDMWLKPCAELTLIHELLHLQFEYSDATADTDNEMLRAHFTHSSLERMAKSLLMARYNLDKSWFYTTDKEVEKYGKST